MAMFIVRVELHGHATGADYEALHDAMEKAGFGRTIHAESGTEYQLPPAEYRLNGSFGTEEAYQKARAAADRIGKNYGMVVTESNGGLLFNLAVAR